MLSLAGGVLGLALAVRLSSRPAGARRRSHSGAAARSGRARSSCRRLHVRHGAGNGLLFGLIPALLASAMANDALREGGRHGAGPRSRRMLGALVVVEVALSLVLLTGAGLLIRSFVRLQNVDPGFRAEGVLTARVSLPGARYPQPRDSAAFFETRRQPHSRAARRAERGGHRVPADVRPQSAPASTGSIGPVPADGQAPSTQVRPVTPGFFRTMGIPLRAGRDFTDADRDGAPPSRSSAKASCGSCIRGRIRSASGCRSTRAARTASRSRSSASSAMSRLSSLDSETPAAVYLPNAQLSIGLMTFVVRTGRAAAVAVEQRRRSRAQASIPKCRSPTSGRWSRS